MVLVNSIGNCVIMTLNVLVVVTYLSEGGPPVLFHHHVVSYNILIMAIVRLL